MEQLKTIREAGLELEHIRDLQKLTMKVFIGAVTMNLAAMGFLYTKIDKVYENSMETGLAAAKISKDVDVLSADVELLMGWLYPEALKAFSDRPRFRSLPIF